MEKNNNTERSKCKKNNKNNTNIIHGKKNNMYDTKWTQSEVSKGSSF